MLVDERSLKVLDFPSICASVARETRVDRATREAEAMHPASDIEVVRIEQLATAEMRRLLDEGGFSIPRTADVTSELERAVVGSSLAPRELRAVGDALAVAQAAVERVRSGAGPVLPERCSAFVPRPDLVRAIAESIDERGEDVLDRASPELLRLRGRIAAAQDAARERCTAIVRSAKYSRLLQEPVVTMREGRFVVPIKAEFGGEFAGVVHDSSSSGATLFVEPLAALESNNRLRTLRIEAEREVARVLAALSRLVGAAAVQISCNLEVLATLDLSLAKARVAAAMDAVAPVLCDEAIVDIRNGRHPLLGTRAVPQSVMLESGTRLLVVSGPNMGGKTVSLKMVGVLTVMAYCGMQIPAGDGSRIGRFTEIFTDIGDEQSIADNASTFSAHLRRLVWILNHAGERSLVLVDEIAAGTEPSSGAALGIAVLERLLGLGARGIVTTHSTELKLFAQSKSGVGNASVRFDPATYAPTYELDLGVPGQSLAFPLARALRLDEAVIARAESLLSQSERDYEGALHELAELRTRAAAEREAVAVERRRLSDLEAQLAARSASLERERRAFMEGAAERLSAALRSFTAELARRQTARESRPRATPAQSALLSRTLEELHREIGLRDDVPHATAPIRIGDRVRVRPLGQSGVVLEDRGATALIAIGSMRSEVPKGELEPSGRVAHDPSPAAASTMAFGAASEAAVELDVRGKRFVEAQPIVEQWIDEAVLLEYSPLRLIHGKGTGLLGRGLQEYLRGHPDVARVRYGEDGEGGSGVTILELRR